MKIKPQKETGHVLVAGSEEMLQKVLSNVLKEAGYDVTTANDGLEALYSINTFHITENPFDLIVLDANVPKLSCSALSAKLDHLNITIPMIIIKAKNNDGNHHLPAKENILSLETPVSKDELLQKMKALVENSNRSNQTVN